MAHEPGKPPQPVLQSKPLPFSHPVRVEELKLRATTIVVTAP